MTDNRSWKHHQPVRIFSGALQNTLPAALQSLLPANNTALSAVVLLVTSAGFTRRGQTKKLAALVEPFKLVVIDDVTANPDLDKLDSWISQYTSQPVAAVLGLGGGSVMDSAKVLAAMLPLASKHSTPLHRLFREKKIHLPEQRLPMILIPTTAGTGSEVTPFATIWDHTHKQKYSLSGQSVYPDIALLDASLTLSLPADETLYSGLDALSHSLESLWNQHRTPISEAYAKQAIELLAEHFITVLTSPSDLVARQAMQTASLLAGLAISNTRTAIAHAISYPLTSHYGVPHGVACSFTLPALLEMVQSAAALPQLDATFTSAANLLQQLPLHQALHAHVSFAQIYRHTDEMFHPERAGNFILPFDSSQLTSLLQRSEVLLKKAPTPSALSAIIPL